MIHEVEEREESWKGSEYAMVFHLLFADDSLIFICMLIKRMLTAPMVFHLLFADDSLIFICMLIKRMLTS